MDRRTLDEWRGRAQPIPLKMILTTAGFTVVAILAIWLVFSSFYTVEADEQGVILRFGKYQDPPAGPGLHFKLPFGIDQIFAVKVKRIETLSFGFRVTGVSSEGKTRYAAAAQESLMLTGDQNIVNVEWIIQYRISDPAKWLFQLKDPVGTLRDVSESTMRLVVGDSSATEVLTELRREIATDVKERLQSIVDFYQSGIDIVTVELQNVMPPTKQVQDAFNEVNRARQEKETTINEASRDYLKAIPEVEGEARKVVQEGEGYKLKRVNEAGGDVAKFVSLLEEYEKSKEVTRERLYLEALEDVLPKLTQIYVIDQVEGGPLQILDLKDAMGGAASRSIQPKATSRSTLPKASSSTTRE